MLKAKKWGARLSRSQPFSAELFGQGLRIQDGKGDKYEFDLLDIESATIRNGLIWAGLDIKLTSGRLISLAGAGKAEAADWFAGFSDVHLEHLALLARDAVGPFETWIATTLAALPKSWHSSLLARKIVRETPPPAIKGYPYSKVSSHPAMTNAMTFSPTIVFRRPADAVNALAGAIDELNNSLLARELNRPLFQSLESSPLTEEQRTAVICFEPRLMIVAAAGSGKTATMVAKAAYAIETGIVQPHEILMLAFNRSAAQELRERLDKRLGHLPGHENICSWTFHKFGLDVIGQATGEKPRPAPWLEGGQDIEKIVAIIDGLSKSDPVFHVNLMLLKVVFARPLAKFESEVPSTDVDPKTGVKGFRTLKGDVVKSQEELIISDWLFFNGVKYQYEPRYKHETATATHSQYFPDFYYPDIDLYHEHFALNAKGEAPEHFINYVSGVEWKRLLHADKGTTLIETTSHTLRNGTGLVDLERELISRGVKLDPSADRVPVGRPVMENEAIASILRSLMQHAKGSQLTVTELEARAAKLDGLRGPLFVGIFAKVLQVWEEHLCANKSVDYDDMINQAIAQAESGAYKSPYRLVIADEYQDSSFGRARLLRAVTERPDAFLCVVGDDWQSINRFAGADVGVMRTFEQFFGGGRTLFLSRTFRCPEQICRVSSDFVQANPLQIAKRVITTSTVKGNSIQCYAGQDSADMAALFERDLGKIAARMAVSWTGKALPAVLVLGRYRKDKPTNWEALVRTYSASLNLTFSTVHSSKGAEADYVMILGVVKGRLGFPSEIQDDPILQIATPAPESFPLAEERRLFYVALTRAKRGVFIYTLALKTSDFLAELQSAGAIKIALPVLKG